MGVYPAAYRAYPTPSSPSESSSLALAALRQDPGHPTAAELSLSQRISSNLAMLVSTVPPNMLVNKASIEGLRWLLGASKQDGQTNPVLGDATQPQNPPSE
eukprot:jgi/Mesvir1/16165/Mv08432-RA.1